MVLSRVLTFFSKQKFTALPTGGVFPLLLLCLGASKSMPRFHSGSPAFAGQKCAFATGREVKSLLSHHGQFFFYVVKFQSSSATDLKGEGQPNLACLIPARLPLQTEVR